VVRYLPTIIVFAVVLAGGLVSGLWTGRWGSSADLDGLDARLAAVPATVGGWTGRELEMSPQERSVAQANGVLFRRYVDSRTGRAVTLMVVAGRPGPISLHPPEVCFRGAGYEQVGTQSHLDVAGPAGGQFWAGRFQKSAAASDVVRVIYGWTATGGWAAPEPQNARFVFARSPVLFKMYAVRELTRPDEPLEGDPAVEFMRGLLPQFRAAVFPPA
jgi:hypothetical protein